jgi:hypothetical protein
MSEEDGITFIVNRKGGENVKDNNSYTYIRSKTLKDKNRIYWNCSGKRAYGCPATLVTTITTKKLVSWGAAEHNHGSKFLEMKVRAVEKEKICVAASMPSVPPRTLLGKLLFFHLAYSLTPPPPFLTS